MNDDQKILACVDQSPFANSVADTAAWAALRMSTPLEFLHAIERHPPLGPRQDHSGTIGVDAQEMLLAQLIAEDATRTRTAREAGRLFLNRLRERALAMGVTSVDMRQRHGDLAETLAEQQDKARLIVMGRRGASAHNDQQGMLGNNLEWAVRSVHRPVLVVPPQSKEPSRVLFAFDGSSGSRRGLEMMADSPLLKGLDIHLLMAGQARPRLERSLEDARQSLQDAGFKVTAAMEAGEVDTIVARAVKSDHYDLLVMGAYSHSPWRSLLLGSKTTELLKASQIAALLLR